MSTAGDAGRRVVRGAMVLLVMNLASRVLGFARDMVIAAQFGATMATDAYLVAYTLPYSLQAVLGMSLATALLPVLARHLGRGEQDEAWSVFGGVINITAFVLMGLSLAGVLLAGPLVQAMAPGFNNGQVLLASRLTAIMFPSVFFMGLGMAISGALNAGYAFFWPALAPAASNLVVISAALLWGPHYRIMSLAWGTVAGFMVFLLVQLPALRRLGYRHRFSINIYHPEVRLIGLTLLPVILATAVNQAYLAVNRVLASGLGGGAISSLDFGNRLLNLPLGVFAAALAAAIFPLLAEQAQNRSGALGATVNTTVQVITTLTLPLAAGLALLRFPLVSLVFQRGAFDWQAVTSTAGSLLYFAPGLWGMAMVMVLTRVFYACNRPWPPVLFGLASLALDVILSLIFRPLLGAGGLALANSVAVNLYALGLWIALKQEVEGLNFSALFSWRQALAAILSGAGMVFLLSVLAPGSGAFLVICLAGGAGLLVYGIALHALGLTKPLLQMAGQRGSGRIKKGNP